MAPFDAITFISNSTTCTTYRSQNETNHMEQFSAFIYSMVAPII